MPNIRWLLALITAVHRFLYRATGGRIGERIGRKRFLLLENVGRKTGKKRVTPLLCLQHEACWVVVASNAGDDRTPAWWLNLKSRPETEIQLGRERHTVRAREASPEERAELWPRLVAAYRFYEDYVRRTDRPIPVVILEPAV